MTRPYQPAVSRPPYPWFEDSAEAEMEEERAAFRSVPWPFRTAAEARASVRRQLQALRERLPCRPMRVLTWDDEREMWELRRRHSGLMRLELSCNQAIKEMSMPETMLPPEWYQAHAMLSAIDAARNLAKIAGYAAITAALDAAWNEGLVRQGDILRLECETAALRGVAA